MDSVTTPLAYAELTAHSLHLIVLSGREIVAVGAFPLDAPHDLAAFVAAHNLAGVRRASYLGVKNHFLLYPWDAALDAIWRSPDALAPHVARLARELESAQIAAVVCDATTGAAPDSSLPAPWVLAAAEANAFDGAARDLAALGLPPADLTLAIPPHLGAVIGSLADGDTALVVSLGTDDAVLAWVGASGVQAVAGAAVGYGTMFETAQRAIGLRFAAAAGKLLFNEKYDISEVAPKVVGVMAARLRPALDTRPAKILHLVGITPAQSWLAQGVAAALGLKVWIPESRAFCARFGLEPPESGLPSAFAGLVALAGAAPEDAPWVRPTLDVLIARHQAALAKPAPEPTPVAPPPPPAPEPTFEPVPPAPTFVFPAPPHVANLAASPARDDRLPEAPRVPRAGPPKKKKNRSPAFVVGGVAFASLVGFAAYASFKEGWVSRVMLSPSEALPPDSATPAGEVRKFSNARYRFEVSPKGVIHSLATSRSEVWIESIGGIELQANSFGADGRSKWFTVGGAGDPDYTAEVLKEMRDGNTVFDVKVRHPRFELEQTITCLDDRLQVVLRFKPLNLVDPRGRIAAIHAVRVLPVSLNPAHRMQATAPGQFLYSMKSGALVVVFDDTQWSRDGAGGKQMIAAEEGGVAFHFSDRTQSGQNRLSYSILMPP
jgi:hypothetical protein